MTPSDKEFRDRQMPILRHHSKQKENPLQVEFCERCGWMTGDVLRQAPHDASSLQASPAGDADSLRASHCDARAAWQARPRDGFERLSGTCRPGAPSMPFRHGVDASALQSRAADEASEHAQRSRHVVGDVPALEQRENDGALQPAPSGADDVCVTLQLRRCADVRRHELTCYVSLRRRPLPDAVRGECGQRAQRGAFELLLRNPRSPTVNARLLHERLIVRSRQQWSSCQTGTRRPPCQYR